MQFSVSVHDMWRAYLRMSGEDPATTRMIFTAWHFGDNTTDADGLAMLAKAGRKRCDRTRSLGL